MPVRIRLFNTCQFPVLNFRTVGDCKRREIFDINIFMICFSLLFSFLASCFYFVKLVKYCVCQCFNKELLTYLLTMHD